MHGGVKSLLPIIFLFAVLASSGCISLDPQALAMANPMIQEFLEEHPNAEIKITHFSALESENILEDIRSDCDNPYIGAKEFYRVNITDPDTDFVAVVWVDWESKNIECAWKLGTEGKETDKPKEDQGCEHHAKYMCKSGHIYWYDSCGNKEEKKEYCSSGCTDGSPECYGGEGCASHAEYKCYGDHVYWYDSCGNKEEKKEYCSGGCEDGYCKGEKTCEEMDGYCVYYPINATASSSGGSGSAAASSTASCDECGTESTSTASTEVSATGMIHAESSASSTATSDGTSTTSADTSIDSDSYSCSDGYVHASYYCPDNGYCCIPEGKACQSQYEHKCYEGHVYWYDSCGNKESKKEYCSYGCEGGRCKDASEEGCAESDDGYDVYEYGCAESGDSRLCDHCNSDGTLTEKYCTDSGTISAKTEECPEGYVCDGNACVPEYCRDEDHACTIDDIPCCSGLEEVPMALEEGGECIAANCGSICRPCGNGVCDDNENACSCPEDCTGGEECYETDGGYDVEYAGVVEVGEERYEDYCVEDVLMEYMCSNGAMAVEAYECGHGCEEGACIQACAGEGEQYSAVYTEEYPSACCANLTEWASGMDTSISVGTECYETGLLSGSAVGTCIDCGNGVCDELEDVCNCPEDCTGNENSDYANSTAFCEEYVGAAMDIAETCGEYPGQIELCGLCEWNQTA